MPKIDRCSADAPFMQAPGCGHLLEHGRPPRVMPWPPPPYSLGDGDADPAARRPSPVELPREPVLAGRTPTSSRRRTGCTPPAPHCGSPEGCRRRSPDPPARRCRLVHATQDDVCCIDSTTRSRGACPEGTARVELRTLRRRGATVRFDGLACDAPPSFIRRTAGAARTHIWAPTIVRLEARREHFPAHSVHDRAFSLSVSGAHVTNERASTTDQRSPTSKALRQHRNESTAHKQVRRSSGTWRSSAGTRRHWDRQMRPRSTRVWAVRAVRTHARADLRTRKE